MPHSEKSLFQLTAFHLALWIPIIVAVLVAIYIFISSDLIYLKGYTGLNNLWDIFKVPLALFSLVFPSVALVTANHRSIQSKKQIELSIKQNTLKNYYESIHEFESYLDSSTLQLHFIYKNKRILYRKFFKDNSPNLVEVTINKNILLELKSKYQINVDNILKSLTVKIAKNEEASNETLLELYCHLKGNWLHNYGLEITDEISINDNDTFSDVINKFTDEFYTLLSYCMEYSQSDIGLVIVTHYSFSNSEFWLLFKDKFNQYNDIDTIRFNSLFTPVSMSLMFEQK